MNEENWLEPHHQLVLLIKLNSSNMASSKVALITGGASGMGLAVAQTLASKGWTIHVLDFNKEAGVATERSLANTKFHQVDVTSWESLSEAFKNAFSQAGRLDFVFANAGIVERDNFYDTPDSDDIPPEPKQTTLDVNLNSVINQSYLALHYFRRSPHKGKGASLVMTASVGGLVSGNSFRSMPRLFKRMQAAIGKFKYTDSFTLGIISIHLNTVPSTPLRKPASSTSCGPSPSPTTIPVASALTPPVRAPSKPTS